MGIEPTSTAWKAEVLPLNYTRLAALGKMSPAAAKSPGVTANFASARRPTLKMWWRGEAIRTLEG